VPRLEVEEETELELELDEEVDVEQGIDDDHNPCELSSAFSFIITAL